jgi:DNA-binding CsgD family transcriptional regulator
MTEHLVERIYEAAFVPDLWPDVLDSLSGGSSADNGSMFIYNQQGAPHRRQTSQQDDAQFTDLMAQYCADGTWQRSTITAYLRDLPPSSFVHGDDYFPTDVLESDFLDGACRARGKGSLILTWFAMPTRAEDAVVILERSRDAGRPEDRVLSWLNTLRPHLARALMISARLNLERAASTVQTLSQLGLPTAVLTANATVLAANALFEALKGPFRIGAFDRLSLVGDPANDLFRAAVANADPGGAGVKSIPLPARGDHPPMIVHVAPIERSAHDIFNQAACIVIVTPIGSVDVPDGAMLNGLFDLSPAEARLVQKLAHGMTINQVADHLTLSVTTLRTQLRSVFAKTGTSRQAELSRLIGSMGALSPLG